jgi:peptidyl-prolyl cis-trans isomerase B (cyclophilin B)
VASSKSRQRALARAKAERQIARRAAAARRRRQWQAGIGGGLALALVVLGAIWAAGGFKSTPPKADDCAWTPVDTSTDANAKSVGTPPTKNVQKSGTKHFTMVTSQGVISAVLDPAKSPCTVASMSYLAGQKFFDNTTCGRLVTSGTFYLQCGDPGSSGKGGPGYRFKTEYVPDVSAAPSDSPSASASASASAAPSASPSAAPAQTALYSRGVLAMYTAGVPDDNGSQFIIVYKDSQLPPDYTVFGTVTAGLDVVDKIAAGGTDGAFEQADQSGNPGLGGGHPKVETVIQSLTVTDTAPTSTPSPAPASSTSASPAASSTVSPVASSSTKS